MYNGLKDHLFTFRSGHQVNTLFFTAPVGQGLKVTIVFNILIEYCPPRIATCFIPTVSDILFVAVSVQEPE